MSLFVCKTKAKTNQQKHCYVQGKQSWNQPVAFWDGEGRRQPALTPIWPPHLCLVAMDTSLSACAFHSPDLFMMGRGVSYYGAYICIAHCLPVIKARGCPYRDYSTADQGCWWGLKHALGKLHRILSHRQKLTNTPFLQRLAGKVFSYVIRMILL